jgi:hypothetical protein
VVAKPESGKADETARPISWRTESHVTNRDGPMQMSSSCLQCVSNVFPMHILCRHGEGLRLFTNKTGRGPGHQQGFTACRLESESTLFDFFG